MLYSAFSLFKWIKCLIMLFDIHVCTTLNMDKKKKRDVWGDKEKNNHQACSK